MRRPSSSSPEHSFLRQVANATYPISQGSHHASIRTLGDLVSRSVPGIGKILALTTLYEIRDILRFERVQDFLSYSRLVKCEHSSAGKKLRTGGSKTGNAHLKWAFSEAAALFLRNNPDHQNHLRRLAGQYGKGKALSILAAKFGRAVHLLLVKERVFDMERFLARTN